MPSLHQAGLVIHEIIYENFAYLGEQNSHKARYLNGLIAHVSGSRDLPKPYRHILQELHIPIYR